MISTIKSAKRLTKTGLITSLLMVILVGHLSANEPVKMELDIETAVDLALNNNLGIRSSRIDQSIARRDYWHRFNVFLPRISVSGTFNRPDDEPEAIPNTTMDLYNYVSGMSQFFAGGGAPGYPLPALEAIDVPEQDDPARWTYSASASASLTLSAQMIQGVRAVANAYKNSQMTLENAERQLEMQVRKSYLQLLLLQEQYRLSQRRLEASEERLEDIRGNYNAGLIDELTLRSTQVQVESLRPAILRQRQALNNARRQMAATIGIDQPELLVFTGSIAAEAKNLGDADSLRLFLDRNADIQALASGRKNIEIAIANSISSMLPTVTFSYGKNFILDNTVDPFSDGLLDNENFSDRGSFSITISQAIDPLIPGSGTWKNIGNQRDQLKQIQLQQEQLRNNLEMQLQMLVGNIQASRETIEVLESSVALAQRAFTLTEESYSNGLRDFSQVRDAEIDLDDAQVQLLQEQHNYLVNLLDLQFLLNTPLNELEEN